MADILIKGMEMPKNCGSCRFMYQEVGEMNDDIVMVLMCSACFQGTAELEYKNERAAFCPLVELPEHCDLIDRDALLAEYERDERAADEHGRDFSFSFYSGGTRCTEWWIVQQKLMDAHAIVPSNKEETE